MRGGPPAGVPTATAAARAQTRNETRDFPGAKPEGQTYDGFVAVEGGHPVRLTVELQKVVGEERVEGMLAVEAATASQPFSGWLELLGLLEAALDPRARAVEEGRP